MVRQREFTLLGCLFLVIVQGALFAQSPSLADLRNAIAENEKAFLNVTVEGRYREETWNSDKKELEQGGEADVLARFAGSPDGKLRIEFKRHLIPWTGGSAPFTHDIYTVAYDGSVLRTLYYQSGNPKKPDTKLRGEIEKKRPDAASTGAFAGGWKFTTYGFDGKPGCRFSETLTDLEKNGNRTFEVTKGTFMDTPCVTLTVTESVTGDQRLFFFDPARHYALLGYDALYPDGQLAQRMAVESFAEPNGDLYYPSKGSCFVYSKDGQPVIRRFYEASRVVLNDPGFSDTLFALEWPSGTAVHDASTGKTSVVGRAER